LDDEEDIAIDDDDDEVEESEDDDPSPKEANTDVEERTPAPAQALLPDVPPDPIIEKMDSIFSKKLKNVSIDKYYAAGWSEEVPLYQPWLERKGSFDVSVTDWEHAPSPEDGGGDFENAWSGEKFQQKRTIRFKFQRTTHLYIGPPIAGVTQTQYLVKEGNDRCIVMMTVEMDGIPYSDSFAVEVRWSARRVEGNDIAIDAGVFVRFTKSSMFASKIKSGTFKETSPIHLDLFEVIKSAIAAGEEGGEIEDQAVEPEEEMEALEEAEKIEPVETTANETLSQLKDKAQQVMAAFLSLPQNQQMLLAFVVLYFMAKMIFPGRDRNSEAIDELTTKVDSLTAEVVELKVMMKRILDLSEQNT
jgi:hypothetical protein